MMDQENKRVVLITGASSGFGRACAQHLAQKGYRVYGASRRVTIIDAEKTIGAEVEPNIKMIQMDVNDDESVHKRINSIIEAEGRLDIVVNNAGYSIAGAIEETTLKEAKEQFEANFFGVLRVCREVLPHMRRQRSGYIINFSSIAGLISIPFQGMYSASKFALEGLTEALRIEVKPFGINVVLVEPGDYNTGFTANRQFTRESKQSDTYHDNLANSIQVMENDEMNGNPPDEIAHLLERIINNPKPRLRYRAGPFFETIAVDIKKFIPSQIVEWAVMKYYNIK